MSMQNHHCHSPPRCPAREHIHWGQKARDVSRIGSDNVTLICGRGHTHGCHKAATVTWERRSVTGLLALVSKYIVAIMG